MGEPADKNIALEALNEIKDPRSGRGLADAGEVKGLIVSGGKAGFMLEVPGDAVATYGPVREAAEAALRALPGIETVRVVLTAETAKPQRGARLSSEAMDQGRPKAPVPTDRPEHVRAVLAVASGKGGVGKSTVAVNLACAFSAQGLRVGLLDADVYGPSAPLMMGLSEAPRHEDGRLVPLEAWGVKVMSVGFLVGADQALIWRGPMASQALTQMLTQTRWGTDAEPLDVLVVDLPPGTGDVQLTLVQKTPIDGVVIVSTPQEAALADARRAHAMFGKTGTPVWGLIENMAGDVFGRGGAQAEAERLGAPFLGELPLNPAIRQGGDAGRPVAAERETASAHAFDSIARTLAVRLAG
ncbi:Mrp/NBP35 family ATP-binding protein [Brevundimonas sp.]|uniref:Mrp/NBP35 family ATP-binding protein n=1 Tax=Brevundimonas sp. TaxID=1871086 RepID=UPI0025D30400|nr:Mrp/NBP35 family ATP-binding protein [Brevundimonas sp.]